jgi:hypothetical protein
VIHNFKYKSKREDVITLILRGHSMEPYSPDILPQVVEEDTLEDFR